MGNDGMVLKTINGGSNWIDLTINTYETLYSVDFIDYYVGWGVGSVAGYLNLQTVEITGHN